jgi:hypothetical protein
LRDEGLVRQLLAQLTTDLSAARLQAGVVKSARTLGVVVGAHYDTGAAVADGSWPPATASPVTDYQPCARPGHHAPHVWLDASHTASTLDLFTGGLVLLTSAPAAWQAAVTAATRSGALARLKDLHAPGWTDAYGIDTTALSWSGPMVTSPGAGQACHRPHTLSSRTPRATILRPHGPTPQSEPAAPKPGTLLRKRTVDLLLTMKHSSNAVTRQDAARRADLGAYRA